MEYDVASDTFGPQYTKPGTIAIPPRGTLVRNSLGAWEVIRAAVNSVNSTVYFDRSSYPLSSSSTWTNSNFSQMVMSPVVPAGQGTAGMRAVAMWARWYQFNPPGCYDLRAWVSSDSFASGGLYHTGLCSNREPGVVYAPNADRFVVAYAEQTTGNQSQHGELSISTASMLGSPWVTPVRTGIRCLNGVALGCRADGSCVASCDESEGGILRRAYLSFSISSGGVVTTGPAIYFASSFWPWGMQMGASTWGGPDHFLAAGINTSVVGDSSMSIGWLTVQSTQSGNFTFPTQILNGKRSQGHGLASHPERQYVYVFGH